ncbi:hypothetical protein A3H10_00730 [Candidatus Uhrbacteria bacterium RIFCSPLOWO2_12_FULL_46_10]|uniref:F5/8 type C domain-containing protein n=1 Tax=Candidatus Uhrbacteria bacterium RIFCSPLOWO2_01_FULL_47_25 TaxID=1802402 RepID=A0A1F7URF2_9BACT|nr:MAG: hypothetical protein A2752_02330 [Candidatus Uhrbacteria bacterium RIFCSPHIGHO2_01_FULL_46_23]OGL68121.1 MAG: hypothetical protein A3D60_03905 [Candidatus Uhrbacteria bacterium RIFCSPHIGHO2_02_FULL_47_29]OGL74835.1 MAG: hypothetical protein A3E96_04785 [Candidatus Uhrbacteria bacterium RIFCSPHIGHO2_12_FULL_46_13]OGL80304.1 MAG: hypothetical protein A2936_02970 [Candidatus Uhrbacteria bacterium RIFCSPLOWO2_01_FULL_47_25]OGL90202.1 MAG: hypothetical protein A3H10_00730 [Candidatus Uhrbact
MTREEELEIKIAQKIPLINRSVKKIYAILTFEVGGVSLLGLLIIILVITLNFRVLQNKLFDELRVNPKAKRVGPLQLKSNYVVSLIPESGGAIQAQTTSDKLIDGVIGTQAAPGNINIDYVVDLGGNVELSEVVLYWGTMGTDPNYIKNWKLEGRLGVSDDSPWILLEDGGFPLASRSIVKVDKKELSQLRVQAEGSNYIGIYELTVNGKRIK